MAFIHDDACECISSGLDLFSILPTQRSIKSGKYIDCHPINLIAEGVQGTPIKFTDLCNSLIFVRLKVVKADRTIMGDDTVVAPTNVFLQSLFSQVDVYLSRTPITTASDM